MKGRRISLEKLKENYEILKKKYSLPTFDELNEDFGIEKAARFETDFLIREIRKIIGDKFFNYMKFFENIINPVNSSMFILFLVKSLNKDEKNKIFSIYKELIKFEISFIKLDLKFNEKNEADLIKDYYKSWQRIKKDILKIIDRVSKDDGYNEGGNIKKYFG